MSRFKMPVLVGAAIGAFALVPPAQAGQPATDELNPPPPDFLTCKATGERTICSGSRVESKVEELQPELFCGSGASAFNIYDTGDNHERVTRWYDADGNLTRRVIHSRWVPAHWSNPLNGKTVPYTQTQKITTLLEVPGNFDSAIEIQVGENVYFDGATHEKVLQSTGRTVFAADGTLLFRSGKQPFLDAFIDGDMSVFDGVCAALSS
jgi:hypothetical protein